MKKNVVEYLVGKMDVDYTDELDETLKEYPWVWFGTLWYWASIQDWWEEFRKESWRALAKHRAQDRVLDMQLGVKIESIDPNTFGTEVYNFLQGREDEA